ncbi:Protein of unknown function [Gryllus bimaculatus]|nr:Protein of unknown function [Gryllus bimaculatus]
MSTTTTADALRARRAPRRTPATDTNSTKTDVFGAPRRGGPHVRVGAERTASTAPVGGSDWSTRRSGGTPQSEGGGGGARVLRSTCGITRLDRRFTAPLTAVAGLLAPGEFAIHLCRALTALQSTVSRCTWRILQGTVTEHKEERNSICNAAISEKNKTKKN